jgi:transcriptional regulator with XRE-family HTH domain
MNIPLMKQRKQELHLTQEDIAERCEVARSTVANWFSGASYPDPRRLEALAGVLEITVDALLAKPEAATAGDGMGQAALPAHSPGPGSATRQTGV